MDQRPCGHAAMPDGKLIVLAELMEKLGDEPDK